MSAPADLAAYRAARDEPEPEPEAEVWTLDRHMTDPEGLGVFAEIADRLARIEKRLTAVERKGRL